MTWLVIIRAVNGDEHVEHRYVSGQTPSPDERDRLGLIIRDQFHETFDRNAHMVVNAILPYVPELDGQHADWRDTLAEAAS